MGRQHTMILDDDGWTVYVVETGSSVYHLAIHSGTATQRPCAVLQGKSRSSGRFLVAEDTDPRVGERSLFRVPPEEWVGHVLAVGAVNTSPVIRVALEVDESIVRAMTATAGQSSRMKPAAPQRAVFGSYPPPQRRPEYPEDHVEGLEYAAAWLRKLYEKRELVEDLQNHPDLLDRFHVALADCQTRLSGLVNRASRR